jgi:hypothetical protein
MGRSSFGRLYLGTAFRGVAADCWPPERSDPDADAVRPPEDPLLSPPLRETALPVLSPLPLLDRGLDAPELCARDGASKPRPQAGKDGDEEEEDPIDPPPPPVLELPPLLLLPPESPPPRGAAEPPPLSPPLRGTAEPVDEPVLFGRSWPQTDTPLRANPNRTLRVLMANLWVTLRMMTTPRNRQTNY